VRVALVGNPNVGKTAILNALTGGNFTVGNFPGVTVEKKEGKTKIDGMEVSFIDLPGMYSLEAASIDEKIAVEYLSRERPNLILNILNSANFERNLYLTLQLSRFDIPIIVVLNMMDKAKKSGIKINSKKLSEILGVPVVETVAVKNIGIEKLKREILIGGSLLKVRPKNLDESINEAGKIAKLVVQRIKPKKSLDDALDEVFMDKHLGIPIFLSFMWMLFTFTYSVADPITGALDEFFGASSEYVANLGGWFFSLLGSGIIAGVGSVLVFVPNIAFLFIALSILELSGYMPRAVYLLDNIMSKFGLSGRAIIPMILGFGCNVPAVMATRAIEDNRIRIATVLVNPFMSCSARLPIYILFAGVFFPGSGGTIVMLIYLIGVLIAFISALVFRKTLLKGEAEFIMELPPYMLPNLRDIWRSTWSRTRHFLEKAGTVILLMSVVVWFITQYPGGSLEKSYAAVIGKMLTPIFSPLGWNWELIVALISGFVAKEIVVATIGILNINLAEAISPFSALAFMLFTLLYMPCLATIATIRAEVGTKWAIFIIFYSFFIAYLVAFAAVVVGSWF